MEGARGLVCQDKGTQVSWLDGKNVRAGREWHPFLCAWATRQGQPQGCVEFVGVLPHSASLRVRMTAKT
jgi:hypothetical protein